MILEALLIAASMAGTPQEADPTQSYIACGCGCCGGIEQSDMPRECVADEEALNAIREKDEEARKSFQCAVMGCSMGTIYQICP